VCFGGVVFFVGWCGCGGVWVVVLGVGFLGCVLLGGGWGGFFGGGVGWGGSGGREGVVVLFGLLGGFGCCGIMGRRGWGGGVLLEVVWGVVGVCWLCGCCLEFWFVWGVFLFCVFFECFCLEGLVVLGGGVVVCCVCGFVVFGVGVWGWGGGGVF